MKSSIRQKRRLMSEINVVPYIDVMLVLLVIFMITAPLLTEGVKVDLPQAQAKPVDVQDDETLVVTIDRKGNLFLDDKPIEREALSRKVAKIMELRPKTPVLVRGDHRVDYGVVVKTMTLLQGAGVAGVGLVTEPPKTQR